VSGGMWMTRVGTHPPTCRTCTHKSPLHGFHEKKPTKKPAQWAQILLIGRGGGIRTHDLTVPNRALYQAEPRPDVLCIVRYGAHNVNAK
jgi:hypothetical protein